MKRALFAAAFLALASPAFAGQLCVSSQFSTDAAPVSFCQPVSDTGLSVMSAVVVSILLPSGVLVTPANGATPAVYRVPVAQDVVNALGASIWEGWQANVQSYRNAQAAAAAVKAVQPIQ
jgi:hypothetical protein